MLFAQTIWTWYPFETHNMFEIFLFQSPDTSLKPENVLALRQDGLKVPNGLELKKLGGSKLGSKMSFGSAPGAKNNQVVPAITVEEADLEVRIAR